MDCVCLHEYKHNIDDVTYARYMSKGVPNFLNCQMSTRAMCVIFTVSAIHYVQHLCYEYNVGVHKYITSAMQNPTKF